MGFSAINQLIARGTPSPITSALQGFQSGAQMMPGIKMAQLAPALRQAQTQLAQANAMKALTTARLGKPTAGEQAITAFQTSLSTDRATGLNKPSSKTLVLGAMVRKLMTSPKGASVSVTPGGGTQVQFGGTSQLPTNILGLLGGQPQATQQTMPQAMQQQSTDATAVQQGIQPTTQQPTQPSAPTTLDNRVANAPHPSVAEQQDQAARSILFPPTETPTQVADEKQLTKDNIKISTDAQASSDDNLSFARKLRKAIKDATAVGPIKGHFAWSTSEGLRLQQFLSQNVRKMMQLTKGLRTQKEFDQLRIGAGKITMFKSTLNKMADEMLDEAYQRRLKADFYKNYSDKGGKSSLGASQLWTNSLSGLSSDRVPDKFLDFNVSGTKRNFKDYINTIKNLMKKNPNRSNAFANIPITSLIREDIG